jgi:serine protease Do
MNSKTKRRSLVTLAISTTASAILIASSIVLPGNSAQTVQAAPQTSTPRAGFADLIEQVEPAVVTVETKKSASTQLSGFSGDPRADEFFQHFFGLGRMMPQEAQPPVEGLGSGFIVDSSGYIITNNHVVDGADTVVVRLNDKDKREFDAKVIGTDEKTDLALLKVDANNLRTVKLGDSDKTRVGDWVVAIGNPFGLGGTATVGIVSARGRDIRSGPYDDFMQIDAPINRGNSGGPVFNIEGEVVGVSTAIFSPNGGSVGIGFAIPANQVQKIVDELRDNGTVDRGWLGVQIQDVDEDLADGLGLDSQRGALVSDVIEDSPADKAGVEVGDVILSFDDHDVADARDLSRMVGDADKGDKAKISVWRNSERVKLNVKLAEADSSNLLASNDAKEKDFDNLGLLLSPLTDEMRDRLGVDKKASGAVVLQVDPRGAAAEQGLRSGDLLVQADRRPIHTPGDLKDALQNAKKSGRNSVPVLVKRGNIQQFVTLPVA